jgi:LytS/YehU family sensor histidine kinase
VENAFKHGIAGKIVPAQIHIRIVQSDNMFFLEVVNPNSEEKQAHTGETGIGIANIKRQLELQYRDFVFETGIRDGHFIVNLRLNLDSYEGPELFDSGG